LNTPDRTRPRPVILDCNVWIGIILGYEKRLDKKIIDDHYPVIVTSYGIAEIMRVLKRLAIVQGIAFRELETRAWKFFNLPSIQQEFSTDVSESILLAVKQAPEYRVIAKLLSVEVKDAPYVVSAFQMNARIITVDERSFLSRKNAIKQQLDIEVIGLREFLSEE
jgi:predicted nucleic acid-binding protein